MTKRILVTGSAGFIGYHLCKSLLDDGYIIMGIDNLNDYYDVSLKRNRLTLLSSKHNFVFSEIDISDKKLLTKSFQSFKPNKVVNLAAQAGIRYSIKNPYAYMESNLIGFINIIELCRHNDVEGLIYASSSSVYGANKKIPFSVEDRIDQPISFYAASKRANELIAYTYSHLYNLRTTGLRYFTVYGPWGRPDMAMFIFTKNIIEDRVIPVYNFGNMKRDFTFIDDIITGTRSAIEINSNCEIFNLGNHKSEKIMDMIGMIENYLGKKARIDFQPMQPGDVSESFAEIKKSTKILNYQPTTNIKEGIPKFIDWFKKYY